MGIDLDDVVSSQDSANNVTFRDVIGNKTDTTGGDSIVSLAKQILTYVGGEASQLRAEKSVSGTVEEGGVVNYSISLYDVDAGQIASADIDITGISATLYKSTGGGAFAVGGITQPTFAKTNGLVSCDYEFLAGEWANGDIYKLVVSGITVTIGSDTAYVDTAVWSSILVESANIQTAITNINADIDSTTYGLSSIKQALVNGKSVWHADASVGVSGAGTNWDTAFATITEAVTAASAGDVIRIRGEFDEGAAIDLDKELILIGDNTSSNQYNTLIYSNGAYPLVFVEANNCKIFNIGFAQQAAQNTITIGDDPGEAWYKLHIKGCKFDGFGTALIGIANGSNADAPDLHVEGCLFRSFATGCISTESTRARFNNNIFIVTGSTYGITHVPNTSDRPDTCIYGNKFYSADGTNANGIVVTNTPDVGTFFIDDNEFVNFASPAKAISKRLGYTGANINEPVIATGTYSYLDAGGTQDIVTVTNTTKTLVRGIVVDCNTLTQNGTLGFMTKVDGTNYREVAKASFTVATDDSVSLEVNQVLNTDFKFTWLEGGDEGAARDIIYRLNYQAIE